LEIWEDKKGWQQFSPPEKLVQVLEGNEENGYPDPHSKKKKVCQRTQ
jgi:hypothetical protein